MKTEKVRPYQHTLIYGTHGSIVVVRYPETGKGGPNWRKDIIPAMRKMMTRDFNLPLFSRGRNGMPGEQNWWLEGGYEDTWHCAPKRRIYDYVEGEFEEVPCEKQGNQ